jgi:O-antigen/teichoic acid export membrane protein
MTVRNKVVSALRWALVINFLGLAYAWGISIYVIRLLEPHDYALMAIALVFTGFATLLREAGMGDSIIQKRGASGIILRQIFGVVIFFEESRLVPVIRILSIQLLIGMFGALPDALLRQEINFKRLSQSKMIGVVSGSTLTLILAYNGFEVWSLVYGSILSVAVQTMALFIARPVMLAPSFRFDGIGAMVSFGGYITASRILWFLYSRIDVFIVGKLLGSTTLGFFSVARNIAMMPMSKVGAIVNLIAFPAYSELQHKRAALKSSFNKAVNINALIFFPALWGISAIATDLVPLVLGATWLETAPLLQIICLVVPIRSLATMLSPVLNGLGRPEISLRNSMTDFIIVIFALLIGTQWGAVGVCWAWVLGASLSFLINLRRSMPVIGGTFWEFMSGVLPSAASALAMYAAIVALRFILSDGEPLWRMLLSIALGAVVYAVLSLLFNRPVVMRAFGLLRRK